MSTYSDSKYVVASQRYSCAQCEQPIEKGERYLAYKPGQRSTTRVCERCSLSTDEESHLRWWCGAVEEATRSPVGALQ